MYNVYWHRSYTHILLFCFFIFTSFNTTPVILLVKVILVWNFKSVKGDYSNSGALILVCRWAGVNAQVQNKFRSTTHLLNQHLLAQSHRWKHQMNVWNLLKVNTNPANIYLFKVNNRNIRKKMEICEPGTHLKSILFQK